MPNICRKCGKEFPFWVEINGKKRNLGKRKFCLECSPFDCHNTRDLTRNGNELLIGNEWKIYDEKKHIRDVFGHTRYVDECEECKRMKVIRAHGLCSGCYQRNLRNKRIIQIKEELGGKCMICGYNKCYRSLCFHHLNPSEKDFGVTKIPLMAIKKMREEIKKCVLVCANCHSEIHAGVTEIPAGLV